MNVDESGNSQGVSERPGSRDSPSAPPRPAAVESRSGGTSPSIPRRQSSRPWSLLLAPQNAAQFAAKPPIEFLGNAFDVRPSEVNDPAPNNEAEFPNHSRWTTPRVRVERVHA